MTPLPPEHLLESPWAPCPVCGTMNLKDGSRRCARCLNRPRRTDLILGSGGLPGTVSAALIEEWYADNTFTVTYEPVAGTCSHIDATAAQLKDNNDLTGDYVSTAGDGIIPGLVRKKTDFLLGSPTIYHPLVVIDFVRVRIRARLAGDPGSTAVIYAFFNGSRLTNTFPGDDYLSFPVGALNWVQYDYPLNPDTAAPWAKGDITTNLWSFQELLQNFDENSSNSITLSEFRLQIWGTGTA